MLPSTSEVKEAIEVLKGQAKDYDYIIYDPTVQKKVKAINNATQILQAYLLQSGWKYNEQSKTLEKPVS